MSDPATPPASGDASDPAVAAVAARAAELVADGDRVGLGSGRAALAFLARLGDRVRDGLRVAGVPTSAATAAAAREHGVPLVALEDALPLDLTVDGADEVAPNLDLVKGWGGALVRERIVAAASRRQVLLVGPEKRVERLGERGPVAVEVTPFGIGLVERRVRALGLLPALRLDASGRPFVTDNGNLTLECALPAPLADARAARALERDLRAIAGVIDTGLFLGTAACVLVGYPDGRVDELRRE